MIDSAHSPTPDNVSPLHPPAGGGAPARLGKGALGRIDEIVEAAESVGEQLRADAEDDAARRRESARAEAEAVARANDELRREVERLTEERRRAGADGVDAVLADVRTLKEALANASAALERGMDGFGIPDQPAPVVDEPVAAEPTPPIAVVPEADDAEPATPLAPAPPPPGEISEPEAPAVVAEEHDRFGGASEGAILLATQMAVSGAPRDRIEARLRNDFGIDDPAAILDQLDG